MSKLEELIISLIGFSMFLKLLLIASFIFSINVLGQPVYTVSKIKEYLQNRKICDVALYNSWIENIPNTSPIVTCITDISRGVGINKISGCGLLAYDMSKDKLIEYSKIASPIAENRSCFSGGVTELLKKKYPVFNIPILDEISEPSSGLAPKKWTRL